jgi:hypothetical protein
VVVGALLVAGHPSGRLLAAVRWDVLSRSAAELAAGA